MELRKPLLVGAAAVIAVAAGTGIAWASIPDSSGVIHGCYKPQGNGSNAALGVIDTALSGGHCPGGDTELSWNQAGPPGSPGLSGLNVVDGPVLGDQATYETDCPVGQAALSIAFANLSGGLNEDFSATPVITSGVPTGYTYSKIGANGNYQAAVTCATVG